MRVSTLALPIAVAASVSAAGHRNLRRAAHHELVARNATEHAVEERSIEKRESYTNARLTYYDITVGETSCEGFYSASDYVVALDSNLYGTYWKSPHCGASITISYGGKTAQATIVDECPGCPTGGLDLTQGLFEHFADVGTGVIYASWSFNDGSSSGGDSGSDDTTTSTKKADPTTTSKKHTTTSTPAYTPPAETTTSKKHTTSSTPAYTPPPTTSTHTTTSTKPTSTSHSTSSTPTTTSTKATPTTTSSAAPTTSSAAATASLTGVGASLAGTSGSIDVTSSNPQVLNQVNYALYGLGSLVLSA